MTKFEWLNACAPGATDLSHTEFRVLMTMFRYSSGDGGDIRPGRKRIIEEACIHRNSLDKCLKHLVDRGYLVLVQQGGNQVKKGWANVYRLGYPHRLYEQNSDDGDSSSRVTPTVPLQDSQGSQSQGEGSHSVCTRVTPTVHEGSQSVGPHQTIDHTIDQTIDCVTTDPSESAERENVIQLKDIDQERYSHLLGWIQNAGLAEQSKDSGRTSIDVSREEYFNAFDQVSAYIFELFGEDFEDLLQHEWSIPAKAADRYQAAKWLKTFLHSAVKDGRSFRPAALDNSIEYELKVS